MSAPAAREKRLIGGLSHNLRSPLNSIIGFAELLQSQLADSLGDKHRRFLQNISSSAHDLLSLIDLVVDVALLDDTGPAPRGELTPLSEITSRCVQLTQERAQKRGVTVRAAPADTHHTSLRSDPIRLLWALIQIVDHAVDLLGSEGEVRFERFNRADEKTFAVRIVAAAEETSAHERKTPAVDPYDNRIEEAVGLLRQLEGNLEYCSGEAGRGFIYTITLPADTGTPGEEDPA
ncbi:MAG: histidine kinase dimerization/phospho-acceptor domain-containing protein [Spirochaetia bacterium]